MKELSKVDFENLQFEYEFPENQGFECDPDKMPCGQCCSNPFLITFKEINSINQFLEKWLFTAEFNDFVLDQETYLRNPIKYNQRFLEELYEKYRKNFQAFFKPAYFTSKDATLFVLSYRFLIIQGPINVCSSIQSPSNVPFVMLDLQSVKYTNLILSTILKTATK